jgi:hypothetical protein
LNIFKSLSILNFKFLNEKSLLFQLIQQTLQQPQSLKSHSKISKYREINETPNVKLKFPPLPLVKSSLEETKQDERRLSLITASSNNKSITINIATTKRSNTTINTNNSINFSLQSFN